MVRGLSPLHTLRMLITLAGNQMLAALWDELHNWDLAKHVERRQKTQIKLSMQTEWRETRTERERKGKRERERGGEKERQRKTQSYRGVSKHKSGQPAILKRNIATMHNIVLKEKTSSLGQPSKMTHIDPTHSEPSIAIVRHGVLCWNSFNWIS